jgi:hypothetical protein
MTRQQLKRRYTWTGAAITLLVFTLWILASSYATQLTR